MLAAINFQNPALWGVMIGWVFSVVLHEYAHGAVAYLGGDYTIKMRGGLSLNPLQYVDPVLSIGLPLLFLFMGGVPLPGGVTYVKEHLLRSRLWLAAMSLAGPATNLLLAALLYLPLHPAVGWVRPPANPVQWTVGQQILATLAGLQVLTFAFNLIPVPPLDGFRALSALVMDDRTRAKLSTRQVSYGGLMIVAFILPACKPFWQGIYHLRHLALHAAGFSEFRLEQMRLVYNQVLFNAI